MSSVRSVTLQIRKASGIRMISSEKMLTSASGVSVFGSRQTEISASRNMPAS